MTSSTQTKTIRAGFEPIPGYTLEEMVGRGGFGEVWRADAPGGLKKAVKFVFGAQDQSRACRELRSLERIKGVHHPFLLTLERFEIVNDQLVIVTELADGSLEDVFKKYRENGSCGIPRDVLVSHLHDAADALDYLHQHYQLQHLDIKPGNLLMVGGHVKVADFGLLKDLTEAECSLIGGLTPIYAPPEVFDGRPSLHSDQYSLAVMYQELLTGTRPFSGRTIAQLATQHVHSAPNLDPLPPSDRPAIARALEKNPARRFPDCKSFVDALYGSRHRAAGSDQVLQPQTAEQNASVEDLPQINDRVPRHAATTHHAMVVALGGTGAGCLRDLRGRVADLMAACTVDLHGVLIDTDVSTIHAMRVADNVATIPNCRTIHIPLRSAQEYRQHGTERFRSLSRRWIYNVPRSRTTEGMRPLGRLALVDHGQQVIEQLREAIQGLRAAAGERIPAVYVIGSLGGGTASGIYLDVVHLLRHLLDAEGLEETSILSMLATPELRADPSSPLALHDTQAALIEMQHHMFPGNGYLGDAGAGFPSVPAARSPLHNAYLVAAPSTASLAPSPSHVIADYIWTDATGGSELLQAARSTEAASSTEAVANDTAAQVPLVRSVGAVSLGISRSLEQRLLVPATVRHLVIRWLGLPSNARKAAPAVAERLSRRCAINLRAFRDATREAVTENQDSVAGESLLSGDAAESLPPAAAGWIDPTMTSRQLADTLSAKLGFDQTDLMIESVMTNLVRELSVALHDKRIDVTTAIETLKLLVDALSSNQSQEAQPSGDTRADETSRQQADTVGETPQIVSPEMVLFDAAIDELTEQRVERLSIRLSQLHSRLESFATVLALAIAQVSKDQPTESNPWDEMPEAIRTHFDATVQQLHELTVSRWLLLPLNNSAAAAIEVSEMITQLGETAMPLVSQIVDQKDCDYNQDMDSVSGTVGDVSGTLRMPGKVTQESTMVTQPLSPHAFSESEGKPLMLPVAEAIDAVKPPLLCCGGSQRLLLVVGNETERGRFEAEIRDRNPSGLTVAVIPESAPRLIHEAQRIEVSKILDRLNKLNGHSQVTSRLLTRSDIEWRQK